MKPLLLSLFLGVFLIQNIQSQSLPNIQGDLIVQLKKNADPSTLENRLARFEGQETQFKAHRLLSPPFHIWLFKFDHTVVNDNNFLNWVLRQPEVEVAQFNQWLEERVTVPDDPSFGQQWQWVNTGAGAADPDADVDADEAWDITTGGLTANGHDIVVCVVEGGGANINHPDLKDNIWANLHEIEDNGIDDDNNGYVDDFQAWNTGSETDNIPGGSHGTGVSGMIGAKGDNGVGITGINWDVKIMEVNMAGGVNTASVIEAYTFPYVHRKQWNETGGALGSFVVAINSSWGIDGGNPASAPLWCAFYDSLGVAGILSCGATTNQNANVDVVGDLPTACSSEYMLSITATNNQDNRTFSGYGVVHVDLGAPGESIYTLSTNSYTFTSGTSFASPLTAGVIALLYSAPCGTLADAALADPAGTAALVRDYIFTTVDTVGNLLGDTKYGGRINAFKALTKLMDNCGSCPKPSNLQANEVVDVSATLNWTVTDAAVEQWLRYRPTFDPEWDTLFNVVPPFELTGLMDCQDYEYQVMAVCADTASVFSQSKFFKTEGCCTAPDDIILASATETEAVLNWSSIFAAQEYVVNITPLDTALAPSTQVVNGSNLSLTGLQACTGYEIEIESNCTGDSTSGFSQVFTFFTECFCPAPPILDTVSVGVHDALLTWDAVQNVKTYQMRYRPLTSAVWITVETEENQFLLESLDSCKDYRYQVKTVCPIAQSNFSASFDFKTDCIQLPSGVSEGILPENSWDVNPNPFASRLEIQLPAVIAGEVETSLYDVKGRLLAQQSWQADASGVLIWELPADLVSGVYVLRLTSGDRVGVKRVVKE